jgi:hypothetical protein
MARRDSIEVCVSVVPEDCAKKKKGKAHLGVVSYVAKLKAVGVAIAYMTDFYYLFLQAHCC